MGGCVRLRLRGLCSLSVILAAIVIGSFASEQPHGGTGNSVREQRKAYKRQQFFWEQRAFPLGFIPSGANAQAINARNHAKGHGNGGHGKGGGAAASMVPFVVYPADAPWVELGPKPLQTNSLVGDVSGRVAAIAVDPRDNNVVYIGSAGGGMWLTTNGGTTWTPLTDAQVSPAIGAVAVVPSSADPSAPATIYAGTGEGNFSLDSYYGVGILKSVDSGATWTNYPGPFANLTGFNTPAQNSYAATAHISAIGVKTNDVNTVLVGAQFATPSLSGIYRSIDGGVTWVQTLAGDAGADIVFSSYDPNLVFVSLGHFGSMAAGVYRSGDAGLTWTRLNGGGANLLPRTASVGRIALAATTNTAMAQTIMWAGVEDTNTGNLMGLYKTTDGGTNWVKQVIAPNYCGPQCWYDNEIAMSPTNPSVVYLGGAASAGLYRTTDAGATWVAVNASSTGTVHVDHHALTFTADGSKLYDGNDGGMWSTTNPAGTLAWTNLNHTLNTIQFYSGLSVSPADVNLQFAGAQDNGTERFTGNGAWATVTCGDGGFTAIDPTNAMNVYAACQTVSVKKSTDGGTTFASVDADMIAANDRVQFIAPMRMDPQQPQTVYFGTYRLWQTKNGGVSWSPVSTDLTASTDKFISAVAVAPSDSNSVYVGTSNGRIVSTSNVFAGPPQWSSTGTGLPTRYLSAITVDPLTPSTVYAGYSGFTFGTDTYGHVFESIDRGASWVDISGDLPNTPVNDVAIDPDIAGTVYIGTDIGVFRTTNGGLNWIEIGTGLPNVPVTSVVLHRGTRMLVAGTHGRGVWQLSVPTGIVTLTPAQLDFGSIMIGTSSAPMTLTFNNGSGAAVTITSAQASTPDYTVSNKCGNAVPTNNSCSIDVTFSPAGTGARNGTLTVLSSDSPTARTVTLTGAGTAATAPNLTVSASSLSFNSVAVGYTSAAKRVTLQNTGALLTISGITAAPSVYLVTSDCGSSLATGASCTVNVTFRPPAIASYSGTLTITSNDPGGTKTIALSGSGTAPLDVPHGRGGRPHPGTSSPGDPPSPMVPIMPYSGQKNLLPEPTSPTIFSAPSVVTDTADGAMPGTRGSVPTARATQVSDLSARGGPAFLVGTELPSTAANAAPATASHDEVMESKAQTNASPVPGGSTDDSTSKARSPRNRRNVQAPAPRQARATTPRNRRHSTPKANTLRQGMFGSTTLPKKIAFSNRRVVPSEKPRKTGVSANSTTAPRPTRSRTR